MNVTVTIDEDTRERVKDLPRRMSASKLLRHSIKANTYNEKQWAAYRLTPEGKECIEFFRPMRERFGCK